MSKTVIVKFEGLTRISLDDDHYTVAAPESLDNHQDRVAVGAEVGADQKALM